MPYLAVSNLAKEFDLHSDLERVTISVEFLDLNVGTTPPFKILFNDIHPLNQMNWF